MKSENRASHLEQIRQLRVKLNSLLDELSQLSDTSDLFDLKQSEAEVVQEKEAYERSIYAARYRGLGEEELRYIKTLTHMPNFNPAHPSSTEIQS